MKTLAQIAADPASLIARMRVGAPHPIELRKAVALLGGARQESERPQEEIGALQQKIGSLAHEGGLDKLSRRDLREGCKAFLHKPHPPAANPTVAKGLLHEVERLQRRAAFFAVIDAYLDGFDPKDANILSLANDLARMSRTWPWRDNDHWPQKIREYALLEPEDAPNVLADKILHDNRPAHDVLFDAGLTTPGRQFGGLAQEAFRRACQKVVRMKGAEAASRQKTLIDWARTNQGKFGYPHAWKEFVEASLLPWEIVEPSEAHKSALIAMLDDYGGGDPRAKPGQWRVVMDTAPGAYAVLMRWLTRASVLQFLDIVDRLMPDYAARKMWAYRRAFWTSYLLSDGNSPGIDAAWVAFGDEGARLAKRVAVESGDRSFSAFGKQNDKSAQHAALIIRMGDLTIVDWSHSAKFQVWRRGDARTPALFEKEYRYGALYCAPIQESHSSPSTYTWQRKLAQIIEGKTFFRPKQAWVPKNV